MGVDTEETWTSFVLQRRMDAGYTKQGKQQCTIRIHDVGGTDLHTSLQLRSRQAAKSRYPRTVLLFLFSYTHRTASLSNERCHVALN